MSTVVLNAAGTISTPRSILDTAASLEQRVGQSVHLWARSGEAWELISAGDNPLDDTFNETLNNLFADRAGDAAGAAVLEDSMGVGWLVVPLGRNQSGEYLAAFRSTGSDEEAQTRWAESSLELVRSGQTISELQAECESSTIQLATDLEELSTLRTMVDRLASISNYDDSLQAMARETLPAINDVIRAGSLSLVTRDEGKEGAYHALLSVGDDPACDQTLTRVIENLGMAERGAVIHNWVSDGAPEAVGLPPWIKGVDSLILVPVIVNCQVSGWLVAINRQRSGVTFETSWQLASNEFGSGEGTLLETAASIISMHATSLKMLQEKEQLLIGMVRTVVSAIEAKDPYTCGHSERVALYGRRLCVELGYSEQRAEKLYLTALLHDVGKIGVSDAVLKKPGRLTDDEMAEIARHPDEGWAIMAGLEQLKHVLPGVLHHHERWDGDGYPDKLAGRQAPLDARLLAVVDAYDAMTSDRPYRQGMPSEKAEAILREGAGTQWDPECVEAFFNCIDDIHRIKEDYQPRVRRVREHSELCDDTE